ncbi:hypothetical protein ACPA54_12990 [Uniformispora flossi]|uniref:hypothetical protein n=1 Tax=Uniformispora flossi TaxID=3390723 RepID=UPI003C2E2687
MARIRTIKPELFTSEDLASVALTAERTFVGLLTQADDRGRFRDHPAVIAGLLWVLRPEHTALGVEDDLGQLAAAGVICRYTGCDGKPYLHITGWDRHQKIDRPSTSRIPACPSHPTPSGCTVCKNTCTRTTPHTTIQAAPTPAPHLASPPAGNSRDAVATSPHRAFVEDSSRPHRGFDERSANPRRTLDEDTANLDGTAISPGQRAFVEDSSNPRRGLGEPSTSPRRPDLGPRNMDLGKGSVPPAGREAPAPRTSSATVAENRTPASAQDLVAGYVRLHAHRPPERVLGQVGREVRALLDEGIDPAHIAVGLTRLAERSLHPSTLASAVNEAMNASSPGTVSPAGASRHRGWTNPADVQAAYGGDL